MKSKLICLMATMVVVMAMNGPRCAFSQTEPASGKTIKAAKDQDLNALTTQAQNALDAKKWQEAIGPLQQIISADPTRWEIFQKLGAAQLNLGQYEEAIRSYEKGIEAARIVSGSAGNPQESSAAAKAQAGMSQMLTQKGNAYLKLRKNDEAIAAYTKAAELSPNQGLAYFNLCATYYNLGKMDEAAAVCDKCIAVEPTRADAYFVKGSALFSKGKLDAKSKYMVPPGTAEALNKYLELSPTGSHAKDVKEMIEMIGAK